MIFHLAYFFNQKLMGEIFRTLQKEGGVSAPQEVP